MQGIIYCTHTNQIITVAYIIKSVFCAEIVMLVCFNINDSLLMVLHLVPAASGHPGRRLLVDRGASATCYIGQSASGSHTEEIWHIRMKDSIVNCCGLA